MTDDIFEVLAKRLQAWGFEVELNSSTAMFPLVVPMAAKKPGFVRNIGFNVDGDEIFARQPRAGRDYTPPGYHPEQQETDMHWDLTDPDCVEHIVEWMTTGAIPPLASDEEEIDL